MKKTTSLLELLFCLVLLSIVTLGAFAFDLASRKFLRSAERKAHVINEMTYVLEHLHKNILKGEGSISNPGLRIGTSANILEITQPGGDVTYEFGPTGNTNQIIFTSGGASEILTEHFIDYNNSFELVDPEWVPAGGVVWINNLTFAFDPANYHPDPGQCDPRNNPSVTMIDRDGVGPHRTVCFYALSHSWN